MNDVFVLHVLLLLSVCVESIWVQDDENAQRLLVEIEKDILTQATPSESPTLWLLGGGACAGKTRWRQNTALLMGNVMVVDPDDIGKRLIQGRKLQPGACGSAWASEWSTRMAQKLVSIALTRRYSVVFDSAMSEERQIFGLVTRAAQLGFVINLVGFFVAPARLAMARCYRRARERGPDVGHRVSLRRIAESHARFARHFAHFAAVSDSAVLLETSHMEPKVFEKSGSGATLQVRKDPARYQAFLAGKHLTWRRLAMFAPAHERHLERQQHWQCVQDSSFIKGQAHGAAHGT